MTLALPKTSTPARSWRFPRRLIVNHLALAGALAGLFLLTMLGIAAGLARWDEINNSIWEQAATQIPRWVVMAIGIHMAATYIPLYIAHGRTRRDLGIEMAIFVLVYAAGCAVMLTAGFVIEGVVYDIAGWPHVLSGDHLYSSPNELHLVLIELFALLFTWAAGGFLIGAAFYRDDTLGILSIVAAILPATLLEMAFGSRWGPIGLVLDRLLDVAAPPLAVSPLICAVSGAAVAGLAWLVMRDIPVRNKMQ